MKKIYLIDGSGFIFRAYHSLPPLTAPDGTPAGAVYGFTSMLFKLSESLIGNSVVVVFDAGRKTFRNEIYPQYKANRPEAPEDLLPQFPLVREAAIALGLPVIEKPGYEADDIIATYTKLAKDAGMEVVIVSSDKDLMQLVGDKVSMLDAMRNIKIGREQVIEKFGVPPEKVADVLALAGDSSDNVPGVPGIGVKTAAQLINEYGSVEGVIASSEKIKQNARRRTIEENTEQARLSLRLVQLFYEAEVDKELLNSIYSGACFNAATPFLKKMGFSSLLTKITNVVSSRNEQAQTSEGDNSPRHQEFVNAGFKEVPFFLLSTSDQARALKSIQSQVLSNGHLALMMDKEDNLLLFPGADELYIFALAPAANALQQADMFSETKAESVANLVPNEVLVLLSNPAVVKISHDVKSLLKRFPDLQGFHDTALKSYCLDSGSIKHTLEAVCEKYANSNSTDAKSQIVFLHHLNKLLDSRLVSEKMVNVYESIERPLVRVLDAVEKRGIKVCPQTLRVMSADFGSRIATLEQRVHSIAGCEFNIGSPKQLGEVLFERMGITGGKKTKSGAYETGADILEAVAAEGHDIANMVLEWRQLSKLKSTYTDALDKQINKQTGRIHTHFSMTATTTGRLSSVDPNLQNIPIRTEEGRKIRTAFVVDAGNKLISADYSQIELRLLAEMANIEPLRQAFKNGDDIHKITAAEMFGMKPEDVDSEARRRAKTINFGIIYGISAFGLASRLGIGRKEAALYIESYFAKYPGIKKYMDDTIAFCRQHGYVQTLFGRKCMVPGINDKNPALRNFSERAAINAPLQGTAADIIKRAMIVVEENFKNSSVQMILQVHDELLFEVKADQVERASEEIKRIMESVASLSIPLTVETGSGDNWGQAHS